MNLESMLPSLYLRSIESRTFKNLLFGASYYGF
jgi:hypothetical protein